MKSVDFLEKLGFKEAGYWDLNNDKPSFKFLDKTVEKQRTVYAFVVDRNVKYVGVCEGEKTTLKDRMNRYKQKQGGGTNKRVMEEIERELKSGRKVEIYALPNPEKRSVEYRRGG